ncbi:dihydrodipicolinate synthase/N-acetylneuraminate lyase [Saccharopolyspora lacisalsi]|uniref:Dihydrodipicolinate synthase/N-acetylneuraminate lyase n=1 Tax=Halosaccharopolyspora lacisalsi TaxID=1000566 RepID=A0A839DSI6_9PSEU|nr:dihydrodipicolinate synthase family protein [Halosaccharopolyspora lacisalsi]MBA8824474.1 dihydrodipicolinate synthase/N-acetylneuraminate lyase [Halosaccharopolyspora lacisalsi]
MLESFRVLTGSELIVDTALSTGVHGVVPGLGSVDPRGYGRLHRHCFEGEWDAARAEQERLLTLPGLSGVGDSTRTGPSSSTVGACKAAPHLRGIIDCPVTAPPRLPLTDDEVRQVEHRLTTRRLL